MRHPVPALVGVLLLGACGWGPEPPPAAEAPAKAEAPAADPHAGVDHREPEACAACHGEVVAQWRESMHARAHHDEDPIYGAMRTFRMEKQGAQIAGKCATCHNPLAPDDPDSAAGRAGVACGACHGEQAVADTADGRAVCLHCHDATQNPAGVAACTTGPENESLGGPVCTTCHMRGADGAVTHLFLGPHRAWYQDDPSLLARAVSVSLAREGDALTVTATNASGHAFPTGFPGRVAAIRLVGLDDASGQPIAEPEALRFFKRYVDQEGKPTMPPFAAELQIDARLKAGETREATVELPAGTGRVRAELVYRLLPPTAAQALKLAGAPEAEHVVVPLAEG